MSAQMKRLGRALLIMVSMLFLAVGMTRAESALWESREQEPDLPSLQALQAQESRALPDDLRSHLFDMEDFQLLGVSPQDRLRGLSCHQSCDFACMEVDQGLLRAGWQRLPQETEGLLAYTHEPLNLTGDWDGCSYLLVMVFENADGCSLVLQLE
ncbi:MAG: hypothetical protein IJJ14_05355 [Coriobacteriales bacterium]|nr:hypothetical protein [Coriobacteriales bacterium]